MSAFLLRVRAVIANRLWLAGWLAFSGLELSLLAFPVSRIPGYELSTGLGLITALFGGAFGIAFGRQESMRAAAAPRAQVLATFLAAWAALLVPATVTVLLATIVTLVSSPCSPFDAMALFPVIVVPGTALAAAAGVWIGLAFRRWWAFTLAWLGVVAASALHTLWPILFGPQISAWNHLAGYLPGPIYDEELRLPAALLWFRLGTLLLAANALGGAARRFGDTSRLTRNGIVATAVAFVALDLAGPSLGFRMSDEALLARLGGRTEGEHVILIHPRGMTDRDAARALGDLEFRFSQISDFVGGAPPGKVTVWWYRNAEQKQQLVGALHTHFAKPWRREIHVNDVGFPHTVAKHELAHAMLAPLGAPPFGVPAKLFGFAPHVGVIEGMAVAADNPIDDLSLEQWAAAMKKQAMLPDVRTLLDLRGFYSAPSSRAYTTAGAFLRWLQEHRGAEKLKDLYRDGDFPRVYGVGLPDLVTEWERDLDGVPLEPEAVNQAFARFRKGSLFDRPCAREVAKLSSDASRLRRTGDYPEALEVLSRCSTVQPDEPSHVLARASTLRRLGRDDDAKQVLEQLEARVKEAPSIWAETALALADLAITRGDDATARALLERIIELRVSPSMDRTARVRLHALETTGTVRAALNGYFTFDADTEQVHWLERAHAEQPLEPFVAYLLARKLYLEDVFGEALPVLEAARADPTLPQSLRRETLKMMVESSYGVGDCERVKALAAEAKTVSGPFGAWADDWVERCARAPPPPRTGL